MKEAALVTFFRVDKKLLKIFNGFSFVQHIADADNVFVDDRDAKVARRQLTEKLRGYKRVFCTISFSYQFKIIEPLLSSRWVLGGPSLPIVKHNIGHELPCELIEGTFEEYLGIPQSSRFTDYWRDRMEEFPSSQFNRLHYACTIEMGCYWNRCKFCNYSEANPEQVRRRNVGLLLAQLQPNLHCPTANVHLCTSAITVRSLREVLRSPTRRKLRLRFFARPDKAILRTFRESKWDAKNTICSLGVEVLSQTGMDILNKNASLDTAIEISKTVIEKGGIAEWNIMDGHVFANEQIVQECTETLERVKKEIKKPGFFRIYNNGRTTWPNEVTAQLMADQYGGKVSLYEANLRRLWFVKLTPEALACNQQMHQAIIDSGLKLFGEPVIKLQASPVWDPDGVITKPNSPT